MVTYILIIFTQNVTRETYTHHSNWITLAWRTVDLPLQPNMEQFIHAWHLPSHWTIHLLVSTDEISSSKKPHLISFHISDDFLLMREIKLSIKEVATKSIRWRWKLILSIGKELQIRKTVKAKQQSSITRASHDCQSTLGMITLTSTSLLSTDIYFHVVIM